MDILQNVSLVIFFSGLSVCIKDCYQTTSNEYSGSRSYTGSGEICQRWDSQSPHEHRFKYSSGFPDFSISDAENYCRDPEKDGRPWCYTNNSSVRWEFCDIEKCDLANECSYGTGWLSSWVRPQCFEFTNERCYNDALIPSEYTGTWNKTRTGKVCQRWDMQTPNAHVYTSAKAFPDVTVSAADNYCRDPNVAGYTWCYTTDSQTKWEACDVTSCTKYLLDLRCYDTNTAKEYAGSWDVTADFLPCQPWASQSPHAHNYTGNDLPYDDSITDAANYCRAIADPDPWCYTMMKEVRWRYCGLHRCHPDRVTCYDSPTVRSYMGTWNKTETGKLCQRWDSQDPHSHNLTADMFEEETLADAANFCRDPTRSGQLWCYTTDPDIPTESCGIGTCALSTTVSGTTDNGALDSESTPDHVPTTVTTVYSTTDNGTADSENTSDLEPATGSSDVGAIIGASLSVVTVTAMVIGLLLFLRNRGLLLPCCSKGEQPSPQTDQNVPEYDSSQSVAIVHSINGTTCVEFAGNDLMTLTEHATPVAVEENDTASTSDYTNNDFIIDKKNVDSSNQNHTYENPDVKDDPNHEPYR